MPSHNARSWSPTHAHRQPFGWSVTLVSTAAQRPALRAVQGSVASNGVLHAPDHAACAQPRPWVPCMPVSFAPDPRFNPEHLVFPQPHDSPSRITLERLRADLRPHCPHNARRMGKTGVVP